jgi:hypothetical protein
MGGGMNIFDLINGGGRGMSKPQQRKAKPKLATVELTLE